MGLEMKNRSLLDGRSSGCWNGTRINREEVCGRFVLVVPADVFFCDQVSFVWTPMRSAMSMASTGLFNLKCRTLGGLPPGSQGLGPCQVDVFPLPWFSLPLTTRELRRLVSIFHDDVGRLRAMALAGPSRAGVRPRLGCLVASRRVCACPFVVVRQTCALSASALW